MFIVFWAVVIGLGVLGLTIVLPIVAMVRARTAARLATQNAETWQKVVQRVHTLEAELRETQAQLKVQSGVLEQALEDLRKASTVREGPAPTRSASPEPPKPPLESVRPEVPASRPPLPVVTVAPSAPTFTVPSARAESAAPVAPPVASGPPAPPPIKVPAPVTVPPPLPPIPPPADIAKSTPPPHRTAPSTLLPIENPPALTSAPARPAPAPPPSHPLRTPKPSAEEKAKRALNMEEALGANWLNKLGMSILVVGVALFLAYEMSELGPAGKVLVGYVVSGGFLGAGIFYERRERYRLLARVAIGGGWALTFFTTYAMYHVAPARILNSQILDLILLLAVAAAMVVHTLRYNSQVVTGMALLLGFITVTISKDNVYSLCAGAILALAVVVITQRRRWYELEVGGILAAYFNHYYWLRPIIEPMGGHHHPFPEFVPSAALLIFYWLAFRVSYLLRRIPAPVGPNSARPESVGPSSAGPGPNAVRPYDAGSSPKAEENVSTVAALLNTFLLLGVMKYQAVHPQWAFRFLLLLGAVEFTLGQLPITRRRRTAFVVLTVVGSTLMVAAIPFKYSGETLPILWLAEAEALFLAGVFLDEIIFCRLGLLASMLVAFQLDRFALNQILDPEWKGFQRGELIRGILEFAATTLIFYGDAHWLARRSAALAKSRLERGFLRVLSYVAGVTAVIGIWWLAPEAWVGVGFAALGLALAVLAARTDIKEFVYQSHAAALLAFFRVLVVNLGDQDIHHHIMLRLATVGLTAAMLYACAYWATRAKTVTVRLASAGHSWTASLLVGLLAWYELAPFSAAMVWALLGLALLVIGRTRRVPYLRAQAYVAFAFSFGQVNYFALNQITDSQWRGFHGHELLRGIVEFSATTLIFYFSAHSLGRRALATAESAFEVLTLRVLSYAAGATAVIGIWWLAPDAWVAVGFAALGLALMVIGSRTGIRELVYQAHAVAALAFLRVLVVNLGAQSIHHHLAVRLETVGLAAALLYASAHWSAMPRTASPRYVSSGLTWMASLLVGLLAWYELQSVSVVLAWTLAGLVWFEIGLVRRRPQLRLQAYLAFASSFLRLFFVNFNAVGVPGELSPRFYSAVPLALAFFYVYGVLDALENREGPQGRTVGPAPPLLPDLAPDRRWKAAEVLCFMGTFTVAGWARFELEADWVVAAWAAMIWALAAIAWRYQKRIFLHQGLLLALAVLVRCTLHNFYERSFFSAPFGQSRTLTVGVTVALLFATLPFAFKLRRPPEEYPVKPGAWRRMLNVLERRPDQVFFFLPFFLLTVLLALEVPKGMVTVAWGVEAVAIFLFALKVGQRSYRLSGLGLLLVCVGKIVLLDVWGLQPRDRYLTFIILGVALLGVSFLYTRYREAIRQYL